MSTTDLPCLFYFYFFAMVSNGVDTMWSLCSAFECRSAVNSNKRGQAAGVTMNLVLVAKCLLQMLIVLHGGSVPIFDVVSFRLRQSYHSLSHSAHMSVDPTVAVRITLD